MNVSKAVIAREFERLSVIFRIENVAAVVSIYFEALEGMREERFVRVCDLVLKEWEAGYLPKPAWFIARSLEIAQNEPSRAKSLPYAEPTDSPAVCPPHVRKWMQMQVEPIREARTALASARRSAFSRLHLEHMVSTGKRLEVATPAMMDAVERDPAVQRAKQGFASNDFRSEMAAIAQSMTPEEEAEFTYEFTISDAVEEVEF